MPDKLIPGKKTTMAYSKPSTFKMKNSALNMSARTGSPMQSNYSPMKEENSNRLTLKGPNSIKNRVEGFFNKLRGNIEKSRNEFKDKYVGPDKIFQERVSKISEDKSKKTGTGTGTGTGAGTGTPPPPEKKVEKKEGVKKYKKSDLKNLPYHSKERKAAYDQFKWAHDHTTTKQKRK